MSLGSTKLSVDSAGEGMTDEGGVVEEREGDDDSLMLTIYQYSTAGACLTLFDSICTSLTNRSGQTKPITFTIRQDRHVGQPFQTKMINNTHPVDEVGERTTLITVTLDNPHCDICPVSSHKRSVPVSTH